MGVVEVRVNRSRNIVKENKEILPKSETEGRVAHGFNSNKNIGLSQEGGTCVSIFENIDSRKIKTEHNPTGLERYTSLRIQGKEVVPGRIVFAYIPCCPSMIQGVYYMVYAQQKYMVNTLQ